MKKHTCADKANEWLAKENGTLMGGLSFVNGKVTVSERIFLAVEKLDPKRRLKPPLVAASYCPFCGVDLACTAPVPRVGEGGQ